MWESFRLFQNRRSDSPQPYRQSGETGNLTSTLFCPADSFSRYCVNSEIQNSKFKNNPIEEILKQCTLILLFSLNLNFVPGYNTAISTLSPRMWRAASSILEQSERLPRFPLTVG
jgi:hypothetical protein